MAARIDGVHEAAGVRDWDALLAHWAGERPDDTALALDRRGEIAVLRYAALHDRILAAAGALTRRFAAGNRVALACPAGFSFVIGLLACFRAGLVPAPAPPPRAGRGGDRLRGIVADCGARAVLTTGACMDTVRAAGFDAIDIDALDGPAEAPAPSQRLAFLQYTSGSTAAPKGVMIAHRALWANQRTIADRFGHAPGVTLVGWLPNYHDMGLVGDVLQPLFCGGASVILEPNAFLQRPLDWLAAISRWRAHTSGGPNFAYDLCVRAARDDRLAALAGCDLSPWTVAFNGAEPIRAETIAHFAARFAPLGFRPSAMYPCYGLAESTLMVTGAAHGEGARVRRFRRDALAAGRLQPVETDEPSAAIVSCGRPEPWAEVRIVKDGRRAPDGEIGEIWTASDSLGDGYWSRLDESRETFGAMLDGEDAHYLRTGDLGAIVGGDLYVVGRLKDVIIQHGSNIHPADLEAAAVRADDRVQAAAAAAAPAQRGFEPAILFVELTRSALRSALDEPFFAAIRSCVAREAGITV